MKTKFFQLISHTYTYKATAKNITEKLWGNNMNTIWCQKDKLMQDPCAFKELKKRNMNNHILMSKRKQKHHKQEYSIDF